MKEKRRLARARQKDLKKNRENAWFARFSRAYLIENRARAKMILKKIRENAWFAVVGKLFARISENIVRAKNILKKIRENAWFAVVGKCTSTFSSFL